MKKQCYLIIVLSILLSSCYTFAQTNLAAYELSYNNVGALFHPVGNHFFDF